MYLLRVAIFDQSCVLALTEWVQNGRKPSWSKDDLVVEGWQQPGKDWADHNGEDLK